LDRKNSNIKWVILVTITSFFLGILISIGSDLLLRKSNIVIAFIILFIIVLIGIVFDALGIAATSCEEKSFHSMASCGILEAKAAIRVVRNASVVSSVCSDVVGDICGVISGAAAATIVIKIVQIYGFSTVSVLSILSSAFIAAITIGGKALGKEIAINNSKKIVYKLGIILFKIENILGFKLLKLNSKKKRVKRC
jgi:CBS domain containing-hemolysin-like protein